MRPPSCLEDLCRNGGSVDTLTGVEHLAEPDGFRDFVEARSSALLRSGWLLTGDWPSAEDLVQTAQTGRAGVVRAQDYGEHLPALAAAALERRDRDRPAPRDPGLRRVRA